MNKISILLIFLLIPIVSASNDIDIANIGNSTPFTVTSSSWISAGTTSLDNVSLGNSTIIVSVEDKLNYTSVNTYGRARVLVDSIEAFNINLSQQTYYAANSFAFTVPLSSGQHDYELQLSVSSGRLMYIQKWNMSIIHLKSGSIISGMGNISTVTGSPTGVLDCSGTDNVVCTINPSGTNFRNDSIVSNSQYANTTFLPILTYNGNYPNSTISGYNGSFPNSSISNYILISTYSGNFPNSTLASLNGNYPNSTISGYAGNYPNSSVTGKLDNATYNGNFPNSSLVNYLLITTYGSNFPNSTSVTANNTANNAVPTSLYSGNFPNSSLSNYLLIATYNGSFPNSSLVNYLPIATYSGNFPNTSLSNYLLVTTYGTNFPNSTSVTANTTANTANTTANNAIPTSLYSGNFPNTTIAGYNGNYPNSSLVNYLLINTYGTNFPNSSIASYLPISTYAGNFPNNTIATATNCSALGTNYYTYNNGSALLCRQDMTSAFSIRANSNPDITGAAILSEGTGIVLSQTGSTITVSSPAAGVTNSTMNFYTGNASNLTSGTVSQARLPTIPEANLTLNYPTHAQNHTLNGTDHTGFLNWSRINGILLNLSNTSQLSGSLPDAYITNASSWNGRIDIISGSGPIMANEDPANFVTISTTFTNSTAQLNRSQITGQVDIDNVQNSSFQNSSFAVVFDNGTNAIGVGYYPGIIEVPSSLTLGRLSLMGESGAINISVLYNATSKPIYPTDLVGTVSDVAPVTISTSTVQYSNLRFYVNNDTGNVNNVTLRVHYRRN